ncbi:MAG: ABC transporter ATP-binding protein, partial [Candidatus Hodarchaeales archaeon]
MSKSNSENILQVLNVTKIYGRELNLGNKKLIGQRVVGAEDVSFSVKKGEIFGFLGPNGAGKSTTMRVILDYLKNQTGKVTIFGFDHHHDRFEIRKRIGYIPGDLALFDNFTGEELLSYFGKFRPINQEFLQELRASFKVNLKKKIKSLSKGNRQQAGLISVLASKPEFLILDEPTSGLDPLMTANFHKILKKLQNEGSTIFLSSHDLAEVQAICDRVGIIKEGKMVLVEAVEHLKSKFLKMVLVEAVEHLKSKFLQNVLVTFKKSRMPTEEELRLLNTVISVKNLTNGTFRLQIGKDVGKLLKFLSVYDIKR